MRARCWVLSSDLAHGPFSWCRVLVVYFRYSRDSGCDLDPLDPGSGIFRDTALHTIYGIQYVSMYKTHCMRCFVFSPNIHCDEMNCHNRQCGNIEWCWTELLLLTYNWNEISNAAGQYITLITDSYVVHYCYVHITRNITRTLVVHGIQLMDIVIAILIHSWGPWNQSQALSYYSKIGPPTSYCSCYY